jgi:hypothetical protein
MSLHMGASFPRHPLRGKERFAFLAIFAAMVAAAIFIPSGIGRAIDAKLGFTFTPAPTTSGRVNCAAAGCRSLNDHLDAPASIPAVYHHREPRERSERRVASCDRFNPRTDGTCRS